MRQGGTSLLYHVVINSVSFVDGMKYRNNFKDYFGDIRGYSNKVSREHNLSVIEPQGRGKHYAEWKAEQDGQPTIKSQINMGVCADIDMAIRHSFTFNNFIEELRKRGYVIKQSDTRKYISIKPPFSDGVIRLNGKRLGADYTEQSIRERITAQQQIGYKKLPSVPKTRKVYRLVSGALAEAANQIVSQGL